MDACSPAVMILRARKARKKRVQSAAKKRRTGKKRGVRACVRSKRCGSRQVRVKAQRKCGKVRVPASRPCLCVLIFIIARPPRPRHAHAQRATPRRRCSMSHYRRATMPMMPAAFAASHICLFHPYAVPNITLVCFAVAVFRLMTMAPRIYAHMALLIFMLPDRDILPLCACRLFCFMPIIFIMRARSLFFSDGERWMLPRAARERCY